MTKEERPREKLKHYGATSLTDYELLAIVLKTGSINKSVIDLSIEIISFLKKLNNLNDITLKELISFKGIGEAKALTIIASLELSKRLLKGEKDIIYLRKSEAIYDYVKFELVNEVQEKLLCIYVDAKYKVIFQKVINIGALTQTEIDIKSSIKWGIKLGAYGIIYVHNHPSGDSSPSDEDEWVTKRMKKALEILDLAFIDHIIVGRGEYYSFVEGKKNNKE